MRSIYVGKEYREQGVGTEFMKWIENKAKKLKRPYVIIHTSTDGKTDILGCFIKKLGYKQLKPFVQLIWRKKIK